MREKAIIKPECKLQTQSLVVGVVGRNSVIFTKSGNIVIFWFNVQFMSIVWEGDREMNRGGWHGATHSTAPLLAAASDNSDWLWIMWQLSISNHLRMWNNTLHTSFEESSRAKKIYITFDIDFWRYLPSRSRIGWSLKWSIASFCSRAKIAGEIG